LAAFAATILYKPHGRGKQSLSRTMLEKRGQKGKFFRRQKLALLLQRTQKNQKMSGGGKPNILYFFK
jgi:hypothetical protein